MSAVTLTKGSRVNPSHKSTARKKGSSFDKGAYLMDHEGYEKATPEQIKAVRAVLASQPDAALLAEMLGVSE